MQRCCPHWCQGRLSEGGVGIVIAAPSPQHGRPNGGCPHLVFALPRILTPGAPPERGRSGFVRVDVRSAVGGGSGMLWLSISMYWRNAGKDCLFFGLSAACSRPQVNLFLLSIVGFISIELATSAETKKSIAINISLEAHPISKWLRS